MILGIQPIGGLGNRMRVINSALNFSKDNNFKVNLYWRQSSICNCSFNKLFKLPEELSIIDYKNIFIKEGGKIENILGKTSKLINIFYPHGYKKYFFYQDIIKMKREGFDFKDLSRFNSVFIQAYTDFYANSHQLSYLQPNDHINEEINNICNKHFTTNTIGIHIRRTDNIKSILNSPDSLFFDKMDNEISLNPNVNFFLATDSADTEENFKLRYKERIIVLQKIRARNSEQGIIDAYIDLLCLSKTAKIYGSYYSSFSEMASTIGKNELIILQK